LAWCKEAAVESTFDAGRSGLLLPDTAPNRSYMVSLEAWMPSDDLDIVPTRSNEFSDTPLITRHGGLNAGHRVRRTLNHPP
jgi:hypothetical protein